MLYTHTHSRIYLRGFLLETFLLKTNSGLGTVRLCVLAITYHRLEYKQQK
jgi:hypothetical protein